MLPCTPLFSQEAEESSSASVREQPSKDSHPEKISQSERVNQESIAEKAPVVVVATRTEKTLDEVPSSVEVISSEELEREQPRTIADALLDIPNIIVEAPENPVFTRVSIRGSDADQITYLIDGVRQDNYTMSGNRPAFLFIDPEMVKQIEVRRGGGSSLYGNGGIGGTIAVTTKTAQDLLKPGKKFGARIKSGYESAAEEGSSSAFVYGQHGIFDAVIGISHREGGRLTTSKDGKRSDTPRDSKYDAFMSKFTMRPSEDNVFTFAYNFDDTDMWSGVVSDRVIYDLTQHRLNGSWDYKNGDFVNLVLNAQWISRDNGFDGRSYNPEAYFKDNFESYSLNLQNTSFFEFGGMHAVTYGFDAAASEQKAFDVYGAPDVSRPHSSAIDAGIFIQDEYTITEQLILTPVLRYSYYDRDPKLSGNDKYGLSPRSDSKLTPGVTLTVAPTESLSFYGSVQTGYRPPFLDELYTAIDYPAWGMHSVVLPNPNLKPEESVNMELGVNGNFENVFAEEDRFQFRASVFRDEVKNLINAGPTGEMDPTYTILYYSVENVGRAVKQGFEMGASYYLWDFDFHLNYGYLHAEDKSTGTRIRGLTPQQGTFRAGYTHSPWNLNFWYRLRALKGGESSIETAWNSGEYKHLGSFTTHSLGVTWTPSIKDFADVSVNFIAENIANKEYRYLNGGYGAGRSFSVFVALAF